LCHLKRIRQAMKVNVTQFCPTFYNPMDYRVHGILQAIILEWVAVPFSRGSSQPRDWTQVSHIAGVDQFSILHSELNTDLSSNTLAI